MSDKNKFLVFIAIVVLLLVSSIVIAANEYKYIPNIDPHTRYNNQRNDCYYYYGYGSCAVAKMHCNGVAVGKDKFVDLGDACQRNELPKLNPPQTSEGPENTIITENGKITIYINKLSNLQITEGQKVVINVTCIDEDPVTTTYSGWTTTRITQTDYNDAGIYNQTVTCTDSFKATISASFNINIVDENRRPLFKLFDWKIEPQKTNFTMTK